MSRPGPKPKPTRLKVIRGEWDHRTMMPEPQAEFGECPPPPDLAAPARKIWEDLGPELVRKGLLCPRYANEFRAYCTAEAELLRVESRLAESGAIVPGKDGYLVSAPAAREFRYFAQLTHQLGAAFGLTPLAVTQLAHAAHDSLKQERGEPDRLLG